MLIEPKIMNFICTTAHPEGCAKMVEEQINYIKNNPPLSGPKNVLIIGASTGYGLATRIVSTFGAGAKTLGIFFEKPGGDERCASPGWYNSAAFEEFASRDGHYAKSINIDAFSQEAKELAAAAIKQDLGKIDLVIYSLASPRRIHPVTKEVFSTVLKPINQSLNAKSINPFKGEIIEKQLEPATEQEIANTIAVMGGEDWELWINYLKNEELLADQCTTVAYSYYGPKLTYGIYKEGTIGQAKEHLKNSAETLNQLLQDLNGRAFISVNKAVVTQASAAIPMVPLYLCLLLKLMDEQGTDEGCIEQIYRLFHQELYAKKSASHNDIHIYLDNYELAPEIQKEITALWPIITTDNIYRTTDLMRYRRMFKQLFGFDVDGIEYERDVNPIVPIKSIK